MRRDADPGTDQPRALHLGEERERLGHNYVGTEHALLGLLAWHMLAALGVGASR